MSFETSMTLPLIMQLFTTIKADDDKITTTTTKMTSFTVLKVF